WSKDTGIIESAGILRGIVDGSMSPAGVVPGFRLRTNEIRRVVRAAAALVMNLLRIWTQRTRASDRALRIVALPLGGDDSAGRVPLFTPTSETTRHPGVRVGWGRGNDRSEGIRAGAAAAMLHTRRHVQPHE